MNIYLVVILVTLVLEYVVQSTARSLNLRSLQSELPAAFKGYYDDEKYKRSQEYAKANGRFGMVSASFSLAVTLAFILGGGFHLVDVWTRSLGFAELSTGLVFFGVLFLLSDIASMPFSLYRTFVIEQDFGFNKMTVGMYFKDKVKAYALVTVLGGLLLSGILYFFEEAGELAWLWAWAIVSLFVLVLPPIFTTFIAPLFNKFEPLPEGELKQALSTYASKVDFPLTGVYVMDGSKRSGHSNAYFSGFGKNKRIALFDTLVEKHSVEELVAILAHEIGHYKKKHIVQGTVMSIVQLGVLFALLSLFISEEGLFEAFQVETVSAHAGLVFFSLLYSPISFFLGIAQNAWSRRNEFEADAFAAQTLGTPLSLIEGLKTLSVANLGNLTPHGLTVFLNYTHPPILTRIERLAELR